MSRIGKKHIPLPTGTHIHQEGRQVKVTGPKGELAMQVPLGASLEVTPEHIQVQVDESMKTANAIWGLTRSLLANLVTGVSQGFQRVLEITGIGYRAAIEGNTLTLNLGYSHPVLFQLPDGISATVEKNTQIRLSGIDRELLGHTAASLRRLRPPEPYKGKGIRYDDEKIIRKAGKTGTK